MIQKEDLDEPKLAKLPLDYYGIFLEFYMKGGKPTIQKDVVIICLKTLPPLDNEEQPKDPAEFAIMISVVTST